jgi:hypothetical protein
MRLANSPCMPWKDLARRYLFKTLSPQSTGEANSRSIAHQLYHTPFMICHPSLVFPISNQLSHHGQLDLATCSELLAFVALRRKDVFVGPQHLQQHFQISWPLTRRNGPQYTSVKIMRGGVWMLRIFDGGDNEGAGVIDGRSDLDCKQQ